jgi:hypothetical protein
MRCPRFIRPTSFRRLRAAAPLVVVPVLILARGFNPAAQNIGNSAAAVPQNEWLTWGYDQERTLWNRAE